MLTELFNLALIVPTFERDHFLARLLDYLAIKNTPCKVIVGDSSGPATLYANAQECQKAASVIDVEHCCFPDGIELRSKMVRLLEHAGSEFVAICADDDFVCPDALQQCVAFLQENPDYSAVQGAAVTFSVVGTERGNPVFCPQPLNSPRSIEEECPFSRLAAHLGQYFPTYYAVHRRKQLLENFRITDRHTDEAWFAELLPSCLTVIQGKVKRLETLFYLDERHHCNFGIWSKPWSRFVLEAEFSRRYGKFRDALLLMRSAGNVRMNSVDDKNLVDRAFERYIQDRIGRMVESKSNLTSRSLRHLLSGVFGTVRHWGSFCQRLGAVRRRMRASPWKYVMNSSFRSELALIEQMVLKHQVSNRGTVRFKTRIEAVADEAD